MKTQIIQLEAHDDVTSTRDKLGTSQANRVLLVWPRKGHILDRQLDLTLINRHAKYLGIQIGLITKNHTVRSLATATGIPTFNSTHQAQTASWRIKRRNPKRIRLERKKPDLADLYQNANPTPVKWLEHPGIRVSVFAISLLAVAALMAALLPSAHVTISPQTKEQSLSITVESNESISTPTLMGDLPVVWDEVVVEGRDSISASGTTFVPENAATGHVIFKNLTDKALKIPSGTVVTTLNPPLIKFFTTREVNIYAGIGSTATAPIQAEIPGRSGNLPEGQLQAIEGDIGLSLTVDNPTPTRNGSEQPVPSPTEGDRATLHARLMETLEQTAYQEILRNQESTSQVSDFPITPTLRLKQTVAEEYSVEPNQPADEITLILRLSFEYQSVKADHIVNIATTLLMAGIETGFEPLPGTLQIRYNEPITRVSNGTYQWMLTASQQIQMPVNVQQAANLVRGMHIDQAQNRLREEFSLSDPPTIRTSPYWWSYLPYIPFRIQIELKSGNG